MAETTELFAETTLNASVQDALSGPLRSLRIHSGLLLRERYTAPWGIRIPTSAALAKTLGLGRDVRVAAFHLVESGEVEIRHVGVVPTRLGPGDLAVVFGGKRHELRGGAPRKLVAIEALLAGGDAIQRRCTPAARGSASLICGVFILRDLALNPLLAALPALLTCSVSRTGEFDHLAGVARLMAAEIDAANPGGGFVIERLLEVLCAEAIRSHVANADTSANLLTGVRDRPVALALSRLHARPGDPWSVARLAGEVAMSPSRFASRFSTAVGMPAMAYLTQWRMHLACRALRETDTSIDEIARGLGYGSTAAFHRAFRRAVGSSAGSWRKRQTGVR